MSSFKYDIVTLIELVEARPCLWDKTNELSKNKVLREKCWQEIVAFLETGYEDMSKDEKKKTGDMIIKKWTNIRDSFMKSLRTKSGQAFQKKYLYADQLNFILKVIEKADTDSNLSDTESFVATASTSSNANSNIPEHPSPTPTPEPVLRPRPKKNKRQLDEIETSILTELKDQADKSPHTPTEKETMLLSFLPYIKDMNEIELMDLHMEILTSIRQIKQKRALNLRIYPSRQRSILQPIIINSQNTDYPSADIENNPQHEDIRPQPPQPTENVFQTLMDQFSTDD